MPPKKPWQSSGNYSGGGAYNGKYIQYPLIPAYLMNVGKQRLLILSIFVALQSMKLVNLLADSPYATTVFQLVKYSVLDCLFLAIVPIFRVPWLTFSIKTTITTCVLMTIANVMLVSLSASVGTVMAAPILFTKPRFFEKEETLSGGQIGVGSIDRRAHLLGKFTVNVLPESTAWLNPLKSTAFCVSPSHKDQIPIVFNSTVPSEIVLERLDFITGDREEIVIRNTHKLPKVETIENGDPIHDRHLLSLAIPVTKPGLYSLKSVLDKSNFEVRLRDSPSLVVYCPSASIVPHKGPSGLDDRCIGDTYLPKVILKGVPPFKLVYDRSANLKETEFTLEGIQPEDPVTGSLSMWNNDPTDLTSLQWAAPREVEVSVDTVINNAGPWAYHISKVEDFLGNQILYNPDEVSYGFFVHEKPRASFKNCNDNQKPILIRKGAVVNLPLSVRGSDGPFVLAVSRSSLDGKGVGEEFFIKTDDPNTQYQVDKPGVYHLNRLTSQFCEGDTVDPASCAVMEAPEPSVTVEYTALQDKCAGNVGVLMDLTISGTPPFLVFYEVSKKNEDGTYPKSGVIQKTLVQKTRHVLELPASEAGEYKYQVVGISDSIYSDKRSVIDSKPFILTVKTVADAVFADTSTRKLCSGDSTKLKVDLTGEGPLSLEYEIIEPAGNRPIRNIIHTESGTNHAFIETPDLSVGGAYSIVLISIDDGGCRRVLSDQENRIVAVHVRRQRPSAQFAPISGEFTVSRVEGSTVQLPIRFSGEGPWKVLYQIDGEEQIYQSQFSIPSSQLSVNREGTYRLLSVDDSYCEGEVSRDGTFDVAWLAQPQLHVTDTSSITRESDNVFVKNAVCVGSSDALELSLLGASPFKVDYSVTDAKGKTQKRSMKIGTKVATVPMDCKDSGEFSYQLLSIGDSYYNDLALSPPITVKQTVFDLPAVTLKKNRLTACINSASDASEPLTLRFTNGKAPFSVTLSVQHENGGKDTLTFNEIHSDEYSVRSIYNGLALGKHYVSVTKVSDGNGCVKEYHFGELGSAVIEMFDSPTLSPLQADNHYCIGEKIGYVLNGAAPFELTYDFNGVKHKAKTATPFSRVAADPGIFQLVSLKDSASHCTVNLTSSHPHVEVHDLPSVSISKTATGMHQNIHEGDKAEIKFRFEGVPPFSFTYTRTVGSGRDARVVETHSVSKVQGYEYSIFTSQQGTYQAIALEDRWCSVT